MRTHNSSGYIRIVFPSLVWCHCVAVVMVSYSVICLLSYKDYFREIIEKSSTCCLSSNISPTPVHKIQIIQTQRYANIAVIQKKKEKKKKKRIRDQLLAETCQRDCCHPHPHVGVT